MWAWLQTCTHWFRVNLTWSNSAQSWKERGGVALLLLVAVVLVWFGPRFSLAQQVVLWALLLVALAVLLRRGCLKLFGPVLFYDLVRVGRRSRYVLFRTLYLIALLLILTWMWWIGTWDWRYRSHPHPLQAMAELAESLFFTFMTVQLVLTVILTPAYVAGSIAEEKDRKTLEFLLATDLRNREIVLSKLVARLANLLLILLAGLPVLSFLQFFGGIDPDLLLAAFAATALIMLSLSGVSILCSVHTRKPRDAIVLTYLIVIAYTMLSLTSFGLLDYLKREYPHVAAWGRDLASVPWRDDPFSFTLEDLIIAFNAGNLFLALGKLIEAVHTNQPLADILPELLRNFAIFHGLVILTCAALAVVRLRRVALKEAYSKPQTVTLGRRLLGRPEIGNQPMLWKEIFAEPGLRLKWMGKVTVGLLVLLSFLPVGFIVADAFYGRVWLNRAEELGRNMNVYVRIVGTLVACVTLLAVAVRASGTLSGERDKQTFDGLLTTPLNASAILFAKWVGSIASVRWAWLWLGIIWMLGAATAGLQMVAVPFIAGSWLVYAGVFACVGMWFSLNCKTTLRATLWTLLTIVFLGGGHWVVTGMCCFLPLELSSSLVRDEAEYLAKFLWGQTPPLVLGLFAFHGDEFRHSYNRDDMIELIGFSLLGLGSWTVGALILGSLLHHRFQELTLRQPYRRLPPSWQPPPSLPLSQKMVIPPDTILPPVEALPAALPLEDSAPALKQEPITPAKPDPADAENQ